MSSPPSNASSSHSFSPFLDIHYSPPRGVLSPLENVPTVPVNNKQTHKTTNTKSLNSPTIEPYIITTQQLFSNLITAPKLTTNLLRRPPFRFIHDIVTATMKSTGFPPKDLFTSDQLESASFVVPHGSFSTKIGKQNYLKIIIEVVSEKNQVDLTQISTAKIVAGINPEQTNLLLQQLAIAATTHQQQQQKQQKEQQLKLKQQTPQQQIDSNRNNKSFKTQVSQPISNASTASSTSVPLSSLLSPPPTTIKQKSNKNYQPMQQTNTQSRNTFKYNNRNNMNDDIEIEIEMSDSEFSPLMKKKNRHSISPRDKKKENQHANFTSKRTSCSSVSSSSSSSSSSSGSSSDSDSDVSFNEEEEESELPSNEITRRSPKELMHISSSSESDSEEEEGRIKHKRIQQKPQSLAKPTIKFNQHPCLLDGGSDSNTESLITQLLAQENEMEEAAMKVSATQMDSEGKLHIKSREQRRIEEEINALKLEHQQQRVQQINSLLLKNNNNASSSITPTPASTPINTTITSPFSQFFANNNTNTNTNTTTTPAPVSVNCFCHLTVATRDNAFYKSKSSSSPITELKDSISLINNHTESTSVF